MEKINIAELLKDCPKGMELDCTMWTGVTFEGVDSPSSSYPINIKIKGDKTTSIDYLTKFGEWSTHENSKCVIFPKGKTTWEGFVPPRKFKDGDIVASRSGDYIFMLKKAHTYKDDDVYNIYNGTCYFGLSSSKFLLTKEGKWYFSRLATEEEKAKLFQAIKDNGYKWNAENKALEELIEPKFKAGDKIIKKNDVYAPIQIAYVDNGFYYFNTENSVGMLPISGQDSYELVPNKFDISTLKPFDKVLVRHDRENAWCSSLLSHMDDNYGSYCYKFVTTAGKSYPMCIPYEGNEHLLGTANDCDSYFKTWE